ncbi:MAG: glycosyltransferase family 4 protein [Candidatus Marsarchaeota archaeon]|nr:glycosyltransferase family 4 protein [Candidatus Marsarchaeota archaeon]
MDLIIIQPYLNLKGGAERVILRIAQHYDAPIYLLEYNKNTTFGEFKDLDVRLVGKKVPLSEMLPYRASQGLRYGYNFYNLKLKEDYDVLNAHISPSEWIRHRNERVLWYCHTPPREVYDLYEVRMKHRSYKDKLLYSTMAKTYKFISKRVVRNIEFIAANSINTRERIMKYYSRESTVINPGIDFGEYSNEGDGRYFLCPSRISPNKGQDFVIDAYKRFCAKSGKKHRLLLAGALSRDPEHAAYYAKLKGMAKGLNVEFRGNLEDSEMKKLYAGATAVLLAPQNEDFGLVYLEAMSSSKPVISINEGEPTRLVQEGKTGFLVDSPQKMAERMRLLAEDTGMAEGIGRRARKEVESKYSWGAFFKKFDKALAQAKKKRE